MEGRGDAKSRVDNRPTTLLFKLDATTLVPTRSYSWMADGLSLIPYPARSSSSGWTRGRGNQQVPG